MEEKGRSETHHRVAVDRARRRHEGADEGGERVLRHDRLGAWSCWGSVVCVWRSRSAADNRTLESNHDIREEKLKRQVDHPNA